MAKVATDNTIMVDGQEFEIQEPDTLILVRVLQVVGRVGLRVEGEFNGLLSKLVSRTEGEEEASLSVNTPAFLALLAHLDEGEILKLAAALFQFPDEREGVRFFKKHRLRLPVLLQALQMNLEASEELIRDLLEVVSNFTPFLAGVVTATKPAPTTDDSP